MRNKLWGLVVAFVMVNVAMIQMDGYTADFPNKPVTLLCGFGAGGVTDLNTRAIAEASKKHLGQPIIVENVTGGGGSIALCRLAGLKPDGYTVGINSPNQKFVSLISKIPCEPKTDFTQIIQVFGNSFGIFVRSDSPFKNLKDLIEYARANPGKLKHMTAGVGTGPQIIMTKLEDTTGTKFHIIPGRSDAEASTSLLGGHIDLIAGAMGSTTPLAKAGKLRLLATFGTEKRLTNFPEIPNARELGYNVAYEAPMGILGPKGMDEKIVRILHDAFQQGMKEESYISFCNKYGAPILYKKSEDYKTYWDSECDGWQNFYDKFVKK